MGFQTLLLALFTALPAARAAEPAGRGMNVILVCLDTLRADRVGGSRRLTPELDRFAADSLNFTNAISQAAWTLPSIMTVFTSLYPHQHTLQNKYSVFLENHRELARLPDRFTTLGEVFRSNGYQTAAFTGGAGVGGAFGFARGFEVYSDSTPFAGTDATYPRALDWIANNRGRRFFLFVHGYDVHGQYRELESQTGRFADPDYSGPYRGSREEFLELRMKTIEGKTIAMGKTDVRIWTNRYDEQVRRADERFGRFLKKLREDRKLMRRTVIAVFSDHGEQFYEHGGFDHGMNLYDETIRVPLILFVPGRKGRRIASQVRLIDVMPSLLELAGLRTDAGLKKQMKGTSLVPLMDGERLELDAFAETEFLLHSFQRALRTHDGWKLIYDAMNEERRLFHIASDPGERRDLFKNRPKRAAEMESRLLRWMRD